MDNALLHENRSNETRSVGMLEKSWKFFFPLRFVPLSLLGWYTRFDVCHMQGTKIKIEKEKFTTIFVSLCSKSFRFD